MKWKWATDKLQRFFRRFYDLEKKRMDWEKLRASEDHTFDGIDAFWNKDGWTEHEALLEMEFAKAAKLMANPAADVPKLRKVETEVLQALGGNVMIGKDIARKAGYTASYLRDRLPRMVERNLLERVHPKGYRRGTEAPAIIGG